jgi:hypothetical protein
MSFTLRFVSCTIYHTTVGRYNHMPCTRSILSNQIGLTEYILLNVVTDQDIILLVPGSC